MTSRTITSKRLDVKGDVDRLTHYRFRYPAKFHPPVVRALLERYTSEGDQVLDPFVGSGTLMVEAAVAGRSSIGIDTDPVAVAVARAKVHRYHIGSLKASVAKVSAVLTKHRRTPDEYVDMMFDDLNELQYTQQVSSIRLWVPPIPNLFHWFRRYVIVDLARIRRAIEEVDIPESHRMLLRVVFASIIRNSSNADPVPVSGLEVTSHMKRRDEEGRLVDPYALFERAMKRALKDCEAFRAKTRPRVDATVIQGNAARLSDYLNGRASAVITSPPYHGAVDYYRRHQLEMYWLGQTKTVDDRLALLGTYIGRPKVPGRHPYVAGSTLKTAMAKEWETRIRNISEDRADAFRHYMVAMTKVFASLRKHVVAGGPTILVVGHSAWNSSPIPTTQLFTEIAGKAFELEDVLWYPVKNRYMSYSRHNGANINTEYVLVFRRARR